MHRSAMQHGQRFFETYIPQLTAAKPTVVEIGAQDVNGTLRDVCPRGPEYIGLDFADGKGVDRIMRDPYHLPLEDASVDIVVSSSCFEHAEFFWLAVLDIMRVLKPGGLLYMNVPSNGLFHRYPVDCWRFYPEAGKALAKWSAYNGYDALLLESFIGDRLDPRQWLQPDLDRGADGVWNDCVAIILRDTEYVGAYPKRMVDSIEGYRNALVHDQDGIRNHEPRSHDYQAIEDLLHSEAALRDQADHLQTQLDDITNSRSWRWTAPLRWLQRWWRYRT